MKPRTGLLQGQKLKLDVSCSIWTCQSNKIGAHELEQQVIKLLGRGAKVLYLDTLRCAGLWYSCAGLGLLCARLPEGERGGVPSDTGLSSSSCAERSGERPWLLTDGLLLSWCLKALCTLACILMRSRGLS